MLRRWLLVAVLIALLAMAACSGSDDGDAASDDSGEAATEETTGGGEAPADDADGGGAEPAAFVQLGRSVIRNAELNLVVDDVADAAADAVRVAESSGGFQASGQLDLAGEQPSGSAVLRVPSPAFDAVLTELRGLGELTDQRIGSEDVTGQVVDLEARVASAQVSVGRVRGFLERSGNVTELAGVERELLTRETELETLLAQLAGVRDRVDLATVTSRFGVEPPPPIERDPEPSSNVPAPGRALEYGWVVLVNVSKVTAAIVAFLLPFAAVVLVVLLGRRVVKAVAS